ncbi:MAG: sugar transferase [Christensenellales bacterium]
MCKDIYCNYLKRILDILICITGLIFISPILLVVALLVKIKLGSPIIFKQERPGLHGEIFKLYKFRTMTNEKNDSGELLNDEARLTEFGKKLRASSLDELPEIFNIIIGDMSIVGPRPLMVKYLPLYSEKQKRRHDVRPGLTGLAQISGRNAITWTERFNKDIEYVDNISLKLDMYIFLKTIYYVLKREGINSDTSATMEDFTGDN